MTDSLTWILVAALWASPLIAIGTATAWRHRKNNRKD